MLFGTHNLLIMSTMTDLVFCHKDKKTTPVTLLKSLTVFVVLLMLQRGLVELICSFFVASWTGVVKYHGPRPSMRPKQVGCA